MPIYSNAAFQILSYALEGMKNRSFPEIFDESIVRPLNLNATSLAIPPSTSDLNAIVPGNEDESWWNVDVGDTASSG
jgi:CubicO group peptidase (beta-lactamase class C family)